MKKNLYIVFLSLSMVPSGPGGFLFASPVLLQLTKQKFVKVDKGGSYEDINLYLAMQSK